MTRSDKELLEKGLKSLGDARLSLITLYGGTKDPALELLTGSFLKQITSISVDMKKILGEDKTKEYGGLELH